jgi:hypothetical protein
MKMVLKILAMSKNLKRKETCSHLQEIILDKHVTLEKNVTRDNILAFQIKKACTSKSEDKVMLIYFIYTKETAHYEFVPVQQSLASSLECIQQPIQ